MCETKSNLTQSVDRVPLGVALKCEHSCCAGGGKPPVIIERDSLDALKFCINELKTGLERVLGKVRKQEEPPSFLRKSDVDAFLEEIDVDMAEAIASVSELGVCIENLSAKKGDVR